MGVKADAFVVIEHYKREGGNTYQGGRESLFATPLEAWAFFETVAGCAERRRIGDRLELLGYNRFTGQPEREKTGDLYAGFGFGK